MRSRFWKYFGFPANLAGDILSRKKIICNICNTPIAYNKNTTNLKAHLQARHEEELLTLDIAPSKRIKLIYTPDLDGQMDLANLPTVDEETTEGKHENKNVLIDTDQTTSSEPPGYVIASMEEEKLHLEELIYRSDSPADDMISYSSIVHEDAEEALLELFVESGMPYSLVEGVAFKKFCLTLNRNFQVPTAASVS